jgi:hypothetical protein
MELKAFIEKLNAAPETVQFEDSMAVIEQNFEFTPTRFENGETVNEANQNNGSCKIFAFAELQGLSEQQALACFGHFYREDVLQHPDNTDHQNIRNFIKTGWGGVKFDSAALAPKY